VRKNATGSEEARGEFFKVDISLLAISDFDRWRLMGLSMFAQRL
jgi:hypothetical protein